MYYRPNYDTAYIGRPQNSKWRVALKSNVSWTSYYIIGKDDEGEFTSNLQSELNPTFSIYGGYLGYGASLSKSYKWFLGEKSNDWSFKFNSYGNKFGFEFSMSQLRSLTGNFEIKDDSLHLVVPLPEEFVTQTSVFASFYCALNGNKFSYPAAFSQSYIQKRSAGSFLVGGSLNVNITVMGDSIQNTELVRVTNATVGVCLGYGYNLVLPHNWLIHASVLPYLVFTGSSKLKIAQSYDGESKATFPESYIIGRSAIVHSFGRYYFGATGQINYYNIKCDIIRSRDTIWELIGFFGVRL